MLVQMSEVLETADEIEDRAGFPYSVTKIKYH